MMSESDENGGRQPRLLHKISREGEMKKSSSSSSETVLYVLVTAHPDDESMFFLPTIRALQQQRQRQSRVIFWLLCLTAGNYDGLGSVRTQELRRACESLQIDKLIFPDCDENNDENQLDENLRKSSQKSSRRSEIKDHPHEAWPIAEASHLIRRALSKALGEDMRLKEVGQPSCVLMKLITFDEGGVSGHVNHRDCYYAVRNFYYEENDSL